MAPVDQRASTSGPFRGEVPFGCAPAVFIPDPPLVSYFDSDEFSDSSSSSSYFFPTSDSYIFSVPRLIPQRSRRLLDLFSGTGSVGAVYRAHGWQVVSLDIDPQWGASIQMDIRQWDYKQYARDFLERFLLPHRALSIPPR